MSGALLSAAVVFVAVLLAGKYPILGGFVAMLPIKASALLIAVSDHSTAVKGLLAGSAASTIFVGVFYLFPDMWWTGLVAVIAWIIAAWSLSLIL